MERDYGLSAIKMRVSPNHYLIFTLSSELLANKVVIKIFQNLHKDNEFIACFRQPGCLLLLSHHRW